MNYWYGAAGICINENKEMLMVYQGTPDEPRTWSVPSGGCEDNESFSECCAREVEEETGYVVEIMDELYIKKEIIKSLKLHIEVHYFLVNVVGGKCAIQDPDHLIHNVSWKSAGEIDKLNLSYPEDKEFLIGLLNEGL